MTKGRKIIYATADEIVYEPTKTKLEKTWDKLATHYSSIIEPSPLLLMNSKFVQSKAELETNNTVYDLLEKKVLRFESVINTYKNTELKLVKKSIQDCKQIVIRKMKLLEEAMDKETYISEQLKDLEYCVVNGVINIFIDPNYVIYDENFIFPKKWKPIGLHCTVQYENIKFVAMIVPEMFNNDIEKVIAYTKEIKCECDESIKNLSLKVVRQEVKEAVGCDLSIFVVNKLKQGLKFENLHEMIICYLSRLFVKDFVGDIKPIFGLGEKMIDELSSEFFCIKDGHKLRIIRNEGKIEIFYDEQFVEICNNKD